MLPPQGFTLPLAFFSFFLFEAESTKKIFQLGYSSVPSPLRSLFKYYLKFSVRPLLITCVKLNHFPQQFPIFFLCFFSVVLITI